MLNRVLLEILVVLVEVLEMVHQTHELVALEIRHQYPHHLEDHKEILAEILFYLIQQVVVEEQEDLVLLDLHQLEVLVVLVKLLLVEILDYLVHMECLDQLLGVGLLAVVGEEENLHLLPQH